MTEIHSPSSTNGFTYCIVCIEITKSNLDGAPERYIRKQTLANCERFITPELKELEELILGAEDKITTLEYDMFCEIRNAVAAEVEREVPSRFALA